MNIDYHRAQILHKWSTNEGRLVIGAVLVEFSLHDDTTPFQGLRSRQVECVSMKTKPDFTTRFNNRQLKRRAMEQIREYFDGDGERENLFDDTPDTAPAPVLSKTQEAELQAELRNIEQEFAVMH